MNRAKVMRSSLVIWVFLASLAMVIIPLNAQASLNATSNYRAPLDTYIIERNFSAEHLNDSIEVSVPFRVQIGKPSAYNITAHFIWKVTMNASAHDRVISINYTFFANDNYLFWIREDFVGSLIGTFSGAYPPQIISTSAINMGDNSLKIKANINAISNEPSACYFKLEIYDAYVNVTALDLDGDGVLDPVDPLPTFNNYMGLSILGVCSVFPISIIERRLHKKK